MGYFISADALRSHTATVEPAQGINEDVPASWHSHALRRTCVLKGRSADPPSLPTTVFVPCTAHHA